MGFCSDRSYECAYKIWSSYSFTHSGDNIGYSKNLGSPWIRPHFLFSQIFNGLLFGWTLWTYLPNLKFVAFPVLEVIGVLEKFGQFLDTPTLPFLPNFHRILFGWTFWMYRPNLKFVVLPVPEIIGVLKKFGHAHHAPFSPKFVMGFCSDGSDEHIGHICSPLLHPFLR